MAMREIPGKKTLPNPAFLAKILGSSGLPVQDTLSRRIVMAYPRRPDLNKLTRMLEEYARLKHEHGAKGIGWVLRKAERGLQTAIRDLRRLPINKALAAIIPPEYVWGPIQAIRQEHDSEVGRWMPHITLIYSFLPGHIASLGAGTIAPPVWVTRWRGLVVSRALLRRLG
jgi:hypothetical protein